MKKHLNFKTFLGLFLCVFFTGSLFAQSTFYKKYGLSGNDYGKFVIETSDGGFAVVGSTNSVGAGNYDVWLLKTDSNGDTLWTKTYGGTDNDEGYCLRQTNDNGFIIAGYKTVSGHYTDGWVFKTDADGNMEWEYTFGTDLNGESATSLVPFDDNSFIVSGNFNTRSFVLRIDIEGNVLWEKSYFPNQYSSAGAVCRVNDSTFAVVGSFQMHSAGDWYPNIFTINTEGDVWYQLTYSFLGAGNFCFITKTADGGMIFGGAENGQNVVYKNSLTGHQEWEYRFYQEVWYQAATSAVQTSDNNVVVADNTSDASIRKLDGTTGEAWWIRTSSFNTDYPKYTNLTTTSDGGLIITGYTGNDDLVLVKTMQNGSMIGIEDHKNVTKPVSFKKNFPNPFNKQTEFNFSVSESGQVELYIIDVNAKRISTIVNKRFAPGEYRYVWNGTDMNGVRCSSGIYYAVLKTENGIVDKRELLKTGK